MLLAVGMCQQSLDRIAEVTPLTGGSILGYKAGLYMLSFAAMHSSHCKKSQDASC